MTGICPCYHQPIADESDLLVSLETNAASRWGVVVHLTPFQAVILDMLARSPRRTISRDYLLTGLHGYFGSDAENGASALAMHISYLRSRIRTLDVEIDCIRTRGYRIRICERGRRADAA